MLSIFPDENGFSTGLAISPTDPALIYPGTGPYDEVTAQGLTFSLQTGPEDPRFLFAFGPISQMGLEVSDRSVFAGSTEKRTLVLGVRHGHPYIPRDGSIGMSVFQGAFYLSICPCFFLTYLTVDSINPL